MGGQKLAGPLLRRPAATTRPYLEGGERRWGADERVVAELAHEQLSACSVNCSTRGVEDGRVEEVHALTCRDGAEATHA